VVVAAATASAAAGPASAANPWIRDRPLVIAHQGGEDEYPSNTMYAFRRSLAAGAQMLELDVGVTRDGQVVVMHDTTVDRTTDGTGTIASKTLTQMRRLDGAHWFATPTTPSGNAYDHGRARAAYRFRGVATGKRRAPAGFHAADFQVTTLREVLRAFPTTRINVEIKGRTKAETDAEYVRNAEALARVLKGSKRRDIIVVSFHQPAVARFHALVPGIPLAPGVAGDADWLLGGKDPGPGTVAFQVPITYVLGGKPLTITTQDAIARAHGDGFAWQVWFGDDDKDVPATWRRLASWCADGIMTARPRALAAEFRRHPPTASCPG
jgi:glycerophosphoryl diester phosphodiesterase